MLSISSLVEARGEFPELVERRSLVSGNPVFPLYNNAMRGTAVLIRFDDEAIYSMIAGPRHVGRIYRIVI